MKRFHLQSNCIKFWCNLQFYEHYLVHEKQSVVYFKYKHFLLGFRMYLETYWFLYGISEFNAVFIFT